MFRRILIPTDFSTASEWALDGGVHIAAQHGAEIIVLHVRMTKPSHPDELRFPFDASLYDYVEQQELGRLRDRIRAAGVDVAARLIVRRAPEPAAEICRTAADEGADLVVVATHGSHNVAHLLIGSTTRTLIHDAPAPLLVIRYGTRKLEALARLVVPVREGDDAGLELARNIAADVRVLATPPLRERLAARYPGLAVASLPAGDEGKEAVRYAAEAEADAIVLRGGGDPATLEIVRSAPMPVLVVPAKTP